MAIYQSKKPTKDGRSYFFRIKYKDIFGEIHDYSSPKFKNKKDAVNEEALFKIKVQQHETQTSSITFKQIYIEYMLAKKNTVKNQTLIRNRTFWKYLNPIENIKINDFTLTHYKKLYNYILSFDYSVDYINKILGFFVALVKFSNKYYNTSTQCLRFVNKLKNTENKKEMQFFTYEEYIKFDGVIDNLMYHTFFEILYYMGLRLGECLALNWNDIDFSKNTLSINKTLTTKIKGQNWFISSPKTKSSIRVLPMTKNIKNDLLELKKQAIEYNDFKNTWFIFGNSVCLPESTVQNVKNRYCKLAGVKQIRIHDFRHSCASLLINQKASITLVSKYLGHSKVSTTLNVYSHLYQTELNEMINILDKL